MNKLSVKASALRRKFNLNATPKIMVKPTGLKALDAGLNILRLAMWSALCRNSAISQDWYEGSANIAKIELLRSELISKGVVCVHDFLSKDKHEFILANLSRHFLSERNYGDGVKAFYRPLLQDELSTFEDEIKHIFEKIWGYKYSGRLTAVLQKLSLQPSKVDVNDSNTILHIDRWIPVVKIFYFPHAISSDGAPFSYVTGSQRIDPQYLNKVKNRFGVQHGLRNKPFDISDESAMESELCVPANTLVIAATHGLHRRMPFRAQSGTNTDRFSIRILLYEQITKTKILKGFILNMRKKFSI